MRGASRFAESRKTDRRALALSGDDNRDPDQHSQSELSIFFLASCRSFVRADEPHLLAHMLELSGVFMAMTFAVFVVYRPVRRVGARPHRVAARAC